MKIEKITFADILGKYGEKYDIWLQKQPENYYLTYKQNFYSDEYDFSIEREGCGASEPILIAKNIKVITRVIDSELSREKQMKMKTIMER